MDLVILGIESSCDETSAAICINGKIVSNIIATQSIHKSYGGVVPELASRSHQQNIVPVVNEALIKADISTSKINAIAYTQGPGLLGSLLVGSSFAKAMAFSLNKPVIPVHHMHAHIFSHFIEDPKPTFPFLCLTVSGGHTQLVRLDDFESMKIIGQTRDDAVGEAFDKCAKLLGLGYPGGPQIDRLAQSGDPIRFTFPETEMPGNDFSFSGIKTAFLYFLRDEVKKDPNFIENNLNDLAASIQYTLVNMLLKKLRKAAKIEKINQVGIAGGVSANSGLRNALERMADENKWQVFIPKFEYCTDNAAMIAMTGYLRFKSNKFGKLTDSPMPRMIF
ncbi:MAG: tRNA (adenosine(37)-N6)-threonylcarbamoyltransferase complex transferase subunit TsaD [Bacteroidota bacterium]